MTITEFANVLGWCTILNFALLIFAAVMLMIARKPVSAFHSRMMGIDTDTVAASYFNFLANYKILIIFFNLVPYLAIRMVLQ